MGERFLRATVSIRGVVCTPADTVLAVRRTTDGEWELPGGRLHASEDVLACLDRELTEETGLDVSIRRPVHAASWRNDADEGRFATFYYCTSPETEVSLSAEHDRSAWLPADGGLERLDPTHAAAIERARALHGRARSGALEEPASGSGESAGAQEHG